MEKPRERRVDQKWRNRVADFVAQRNDNGESLMKDQWYAESHSLLTYVKTADVPRRELKVSSLRYYA